MTLSVRTIDLDLPPLVAAFGRRLREAGVPVTPAREAEFARALTLVRPLSRRRLYHTARAVLLSDNAQLTAFDAVFSAVFGGSPVNPAEAFTTDRPHDSAASDAGRPSSPGEDSSGPGSADSFTVQRRTGTAEEAEERPIPVLASDEELLRRRRFDELDAHELVLLRQLMSHLRVAPPLRRLRRAHRDRHGERIDLRRTLRGSLRTAGDPVRLARRQRRIVPRRLVLLCDISGSMEPYARAYLQFLASAIGGGAAPGGNEAFVFATRLTRVTRALRAQRTQRALERAAAAAPDWSSGTRIGQALADFNNRFGRRGMARGAVIVILSDGWERGDPALVAREMERLSRLAHRIVWINPRASAPGFVPQAGGMAAALPFVDALVSGESLEALDEVLAAIGGEGAVPDVPPLPAEDDEQWASAAPLPGSSVAMPSGYGPSRGRTTPGWGTG